jgi:hypothetical protein
MIHMIKKSITLLLSFCLLCCLTQCSTDDPVVQPDETGNPDENTKPDPPDEDGVVILTPSKIRDYAKIYQPKEFGNMNWLRSDSKWSLVRSLQSDHFIVFWEEGFGEDPNAANLPEPLRVDVEDLLAKAESFFTINVEKLKFAQLNSNRTNLDRYKMQIYLHYQTEWLATGAGYDDVIGALWISPATCKPVRSTIAHEIGHAFQYQVYCDLLASGLCGHDYSRGFRYGYGPGGEGGNTFWEQTAQWQAYQSFPKEIFGSSNFTVYMENYHRHVCHEWQRYASYFIHYYWADKYGIDYISKLWREAVKPEDPIQAYMRINNLTVDQFNAEMYDAASRFVTWDIDNIRSYGKNYIGKQTYKAYPLSDSTYQVAYNCCPSSTGYNVIPLYVPASGTVVSTLFTGLQTGSALALNDPGKCQNGDQTITVTKYNDSDPDRAGWRYGYVALLGDGRRIYGDMNSKANAKVDFTIPENCDKLWFVVLGAPATYKAHPWDDLEINDDQWPYTVKFINTDIYGN